ncbi:MAG: serine hydrolase, partial [Bacteroidota bacterium]
ATVDHIITSRSGVFHVASNGGYDLKNFKERGSMKPGEYFVYNNWDFNVAGEILERKTGKTVYQELEEQLAIPLGFEDWNIKNQRKSGNTKNSQYLAYHIYVSTRDMAKIGQLMLNEGEWKGKQIISKDWIKKTTSTVTPMKTLAERYGPANEQVRPSMSYGYMWWLFDKYRNNPDYDGAYTASGYGGQFITVIPKLDLVIAHKNVLDIPTMLGWKYNGMIDQEYYEIVDQVVQASN